MRISTLIFIYTIHFAYLKVYTKFHNPKSSSCWENWWEICYVLYRSDRRKNERGKMSFSIFICIYTMHLGQKKIGVFTVCRLTLFYSCRPYHFFSENKKTRPLSGPAWAVRDFSTGIQIFRWFYSRWYVVKPFTDTFRFCQSKMVTFSSLFASKNVITKIRKLVWSNKSSPDDLRYLMATIHAMTSFFFGFISLFCCLML